MPRSAGRSTATAKRVCGWRSTTPAPAIPASEHILNLKPDIIKLDISLSRDIDSDPVRRALARAMIQFAWSIGGELVAEGVESPAELATLRELGVNIVQGHLCARPAPLAKLELELGALDQSQLG